MSGLDPSVLHVFWDDVRVGRLTRTAPQTMTFRYDDAYLATPRPRPISVALPLHPEPFPADRSRAWFAGLLPEGEVRGHVARRLGVSERNDFALLQGLGGDCAGALRLLPAAAADPGAGELVPLPWDELDRLAATAPRPSLLALILQGGPPRLSLAGAQDKLPVRLHDGVLFLPRGREASTHLLKIGGALPGLVENELFCLRLARDVGLPVPAAAPAPTTTPMLLVERYDRRTLPDGSIGRLHQEDVCQALGLPPETKYEVEGGPTLADVFDAVRRGSRAPLPDKRELLRWTVFNVLIGNADAHAKNVALLHGALHHGDMDDDAGPRLAPFYDLVCTAAYPELAGRLAQKIGGEARPQALGARHWERFAASVDVQPRYLRTVALELCAVMEPRLDPLADELGGGKVLARVVETARAGVRRVRMALGN